MFHKIDVNGDDSCDLYQWLRTEQPGAGETNAITWNFEKFLVDRTGTVVARFSPMTSPEDIAAELPKYM